MAKTAKNQKAEHVRLLKELEVVAELMGSGIELDNIQAAAKDLRKTAIGDDVIDVVRKKIESASRVQKAVADNMAELGFDEFLAQNDSFRLILTEQQKQFLQENNMTKKDEHADLSASAIVRMILDSGVEKPSEIETIAKEKYNRTISKGSINQAKVEWKKKKAASGTPAPAKAKSPEFNFGGNTVAEVEPPTKPAPSGTISIETAKFAMKCGSVEKAIAELQKLL